MWKNAGREEALVDQDYKDAATLVAIVAPYRHARLSAVKLAGDPNATKEPGDDASLEELKRIVEFHLVRIAPVLDLQVIPIKGTDTEPRDGIANCDAPQGRAGNDAGASQGQRRVSDHRGGIGYRHDLPLCLAGVPSDRDGTNQLADREHRLIGSGRLPVHLPPTYQRRTRKLARPH